MARIAHCVDDVWDRLDSLRDHVTPRDPISLSKRDIDLLLDYRNSRKKLVDQAVAKTRELDTIKEMMRSVSRMKCHFVRF